MEDVKTPKEKCPRGHGELRPTDCGGHFLYSCPRCDFTVKTFKPPKKTDGVKRFAPER